MEAGARLDAIKRLTWIMAGILVWGACILGKLISLQVIHHRKYVAMARQQQERTISVSAPRGSVYDRNGQAMALSLPVDSVFVNPRRVPSIAVASDILADFLTLDRASLFARLKEAADTHRGFLWIKRKISPAESERLKSLHCEWIEFHTEDQRTYPGGAVAAHVLGSVYKEEQGEAGIEKRLDEELSGHAGSERVLTDVKHRGIDLENSDPARDGKPITLSIDERIQYIAERDLKAQVIAKHARSGSAIVMNPYNGEILALANYPTFDPNKPPTKSDPPKARNDLGVSTPFEPGSIFKVITLTAALETTNLRPGSMINCMNGVLHLQGRTIHEAHGEFGVITMAQVLEHSSNIGAIQIGSQVGSKRMYEYAHRFGIGQRTGIALPAESAGRLRKLSRWGTTSLASISMGQEVSATSIQLARVCATIANGGLLVQPKLILKRGDDVQPTEAPRRIIKPQTAITMRQLMEGVVLRGTGKTVAKLDGYSSAGKTGTAQIFDVPTHRYTHFYNASFMGFAPVTNPALVMVVTLNGTNGNLGMGALAAGPVFHSVMTEALRILEVPKDLPEDVPEKNEPVDPEKAADLTIADLGSAAPNILEETIEEVAETEAGEPVIVTVKWDGPTVPNFQGKTMRAVVEEASELGMPVLIDGSGIARTQMPLPGNPWRPGERIRVQFTR